jgi:cytoskeletal protein RodZ
MNVFSEELKKARESKGITLLDISKQTRITIKYLEAIEQGTFDVLPQTYIRAFIKTYAEKVGLNPVDILKKYEITVVGKYTDVRTIGGLAGTITDNNFNNGNIEEIEKELHQQTQTRKTIYVIVAVIGTILLSLYILNNLNFNAQTEKINEISFQDIVKEQEKKNLAHTKINSIDTSVQLQTKPVKPQSLVLQGVALDSVWLNITLDDNPTRKGYVLTGGKREWTAKNEITISISDAGKMKFKINGTELSIGKKGQRVRSYRLNVDSLWKQMN